MVPVDFNFMPADHLYAIYNKNLSSSKSIHVDEYDLSDEAIARNNAEFKEQDAKWDKMKQQEVVTHGITIGYLVEKNNTIIEAPLCPEKNFAVVNNLMLMDDGRLTYIRKLFEVIGGKKLRSLVSQKFLV